MSSYNLLIIDLDGTLIGKDETISSVVSAALDRLRPELSISIASGRPPSEVISFARQLSLSSPQISDGGATILDPVSEQLMWGAAPLPPERCQKILDRLGRQNLAFVATNPRGVITTYLETTDIDLNRISAMDLEEHIADELIEYHSEPGLEVVKMYLPVSGLWGVNFSPSGVNKGTAATQLAHMLGIEPTQMIAAGDSYNDLTLFEVCGLRIAMGNAPQELKSLASYVAPPVEEDGLAVAIEEFLLPMF